MGSVVFDDIGIIVLYFPFFLFTMVCISCCGLEVVLSQL